jgi:hypothetical protein
MSKQVVVEQDIQPRLTLNKQIEELRQRRKQLEIEANYQLGVIDGRIQALEMALKDAEVAGEAAEAGANGQAKD